MITGALLAAVGVVLFLTGVHYLPPTLSVRFERRWGGLGSSQGGWELTISDASALANIVFGLALALGGVGLLWPRQPVKPPSVPEATEDKADEDAAAQDDPPSSDDSAQPGESSD